MADSYILRTKDDLSEFSRIIGDRMKRGADFSGELMDEFLKCFSEIMFRNIAMPDDFRRVALLAASKLEFGQDSSRISPAQGEAMVYTLFCLMRLRKEFDETRRKEEELKKGDSKIRRILTIIGKKGRIRHKELAEELGVTPSALTQSLNKYGHEYDSLIMAYKPGREKIYELTEQGKALLEEIQKKTSMAAFSIDRNLGVDRAFPVSASLNQERAMDIYKRTFLSDIKDVENREESNRLEISKHNERKQEKIENRMQPQPVMVSV